MGFGEGFVGVFFAATFFAGIAVFAFDNGFAAFVGRRAGVFLVAFFAGFLGMTAPRNMRPKRRKYGQRPRESQAKVCYFAGQLQYFSSHWISSRTLILPCHGFSLRLWPSSGKISSELGMPRLCRAGSSRWSSARATRMSLPPATTCVGVLTLLNWKMAASSM